MKDRFQTFLQILLHNNLILSLAAASLCLVTQVQTGMNPRFHVFHLLIFSATMCEYNLHRFLKFYELPKPDQLKKYKWLSANLMLVWGIAITAVFILAISFFFMSPGTKLVLIASFLLTMLYSFPLKGQAGKLSLRRVPYLKTFVVAIVWTTITVLIPAMELSGKLTFDAFSWIFAGRFLLIFALALLFDIRDIESDTGSGLMTIPVALGQKRTQYLVTGLLILVVMIALGLAVEYGNYYNLFASLLISVILIFFVYCRQCKASPYYYTIFLDGSMVLYSILVLLGWFINS